MEQYISKSAVVAEIERRIASLERIGSENYLHDNYPEQYAMLVTLKSLKFSIDTLEVKEDSLWHPVDGEYLPEIDREVIVLCQPYPLVGSEFAVSFTHRTDPKGWDGNSIVTGKTGRYVPNTYGKDGWNIPDVKYWLDIELPKE